MTRRRQITSCTTPSAPPNDRRSWKLLLARPHPDAGGSEELFVWVQTLHEELCENASRPELVFASRVREGFVRAQCSRPRNEPRPKKKPKRVKRNTKRIPFETEFAFDELTRRALKIADALEEPYGELVPLLLEGCELSGFGCDPSFVREARDVGAYYARVAGVGHALGFDVPGRGKLYEFAGRVPLTNLYVVRMANRARRLALESPGLVEEMRRAACRAG